MDRSKFDWNVAGHILGLLVSLIFVGAGLLVLWKDRWSAFDGDRLWSIAFFIFTAAVFGYQLQNDFRPRTARSAKTIQSSIKIEFDDNEIRSFYNDAPYERVQWEDIVSIFISIEDAFLPFPYWYIGNDNKGIRMPNDALGGKELMDEFARRLPGYHTDNTYKTLINAMVAMDGIFQVWRKETVDSDCAVSPSSRLGPVNTSGEKIEISGCKLIETSTPYP